MEPAFLNLHSTCAMLGWCSYHSGGRGLNQRHFRKFTAFHCTFPYGQLILLPRTLHFMPNIQFCRNPPLLPSPSISAISKHFCKCFEITIWIRILGYPIYFISLSNCSNLWQTNGIKRHLYCPSASESKTTPLTGCHYR